MVSDIMKRKISYISILGLDQNTPGKEISELDIEYVLKLIANNGFPLVLSVYLVWKLEFFITAEIKEIKQTINELRVDFAKNQ